MRNKGWPYLILFLTFSVHAQDSAQVFKLVDLYKSMMLYHPIVKQAATLSDAARQEVLAARGAGFDPKFLSTFDQKNLDDNEYYTVWQNQIKIPTWFGAEFKAGYDENFGSFLNPERLAITGPISYYGLSVPIGQGLFIDQRRAQLRTAQALRSMNEAERLKVINKIFYEAAKDYWEWYFRYHRYKRMEQGYALARDRYSFVQRRVLLGEEAAIDSVEAGILLQQRFVSFSQAEVELKNALLQLSIHLWNGRGEPLEMEYTLRPETFVKGLHIVSSEDVQQMLDKARLQHPDIRKIDAKLTQLRVERRLATENFKPSINLSYSLLQKGLGLEVPTQSSLLQSNKLGFDLQIPLVYRKEYAKLQSMRIKIKQTEWERSYTQRGILISINQFYLEMKNIESLLSQQSQLVNGYERLRLGEKEKFDNGESSLFLMNTRETSLIEAQIKLVELETKYEKSKAGFFYAAGRTEFD